MSNLALYVATEQKFILHKGIFYAEATGGSAFWQRYLDVFKSVKIIARVKSVEDLPDSVLYVEEEGIEVIPIPFSYSRRRHLFMLPDLLIHTRKVTGQNSAFILRVPGLVGTFVSFWLRLRRWPFAVEVVGDPYDSLSSKALGKWWGDLLRIPFVYVLKKQCQQAIAAAYVTRETLQKRYPPGGQFTTHYSSITLNPDLLALGAKGYHERQYRVMNNDCHRLIFVGSLSQRYKGLHVLLEALHICQTAGWGLELIILGDGFYRTEYEKMADSLQLRNVSFRGYLKGGQAIFEELADADLFVMPSLMEGLPRAMIEAMACGLPCIGTRIGGIPELLADEDIVPPGDALALARKIMQALAAPGKMQEMSERNFQTSLEYHPDHLRERRNAFYQFVYDATMDRISGKR
jgi:glycosyltransferase involved in cell wall biosynthesis